jgi:hypothetical protein
LSVGPPASEFRRVPGGSPRSGILSEGSLRENSETRLRESNGGQVADGRERPACFRVPEFGNLRCKALRAGGVEATAFGTIDNVGGDFRTLSID